MILWIAGIGAALSIALLIVVQVRTRRRARSLDREIMKGIEYLDNKRLAKLNRLHNRH